MRCFTKSTNIINLSKYQLTKEEEKLLNKGLNFIPTPVQEHPSHILQDYLLFDRKLRLQYFFKDKKDMIPKEDYFQIIYRMDPPAAQDFNLDNYRKFTQQEILSELNKEPKYTRFNLTKCYMVNLFTM